MESRRHLRVKELLKREIGEVIRRDFAIAETGVISVNDVGVAGDLHSATVFIGVVGSASQQKKALELLQKQRGRIQAEVGRSVVLKYTPQLRFVIDETADRAQRVLRIIDELERKPSEFNPDEPPSSEA